MMPAFMARHPAPTRVESPVVRAVRAGDEITVEVEGGFARRRAPTDGVLIQLVDRDVFVGADALVEALRTLGRIPTAGR
jgi:hypothetical protein